MADKDRVPLRPWTREPWRVWRFVPAWLCVFWLSSACSNTTLDLLKPEAPLPDLGLLAHWAFDESQLLSTGSVSDSSGFGNHGTPSPNPPVPTNDIPPAHFQDPFSLSFNGQDQWIQIGNPALLNLGGPTTIAAWVRTTVSDSSRNIVAHGYRWYPSHDFALRIDNGRYMFTTWDGANHAALADIPDGDRGIWVHLCGVFDGTSYRIYRNGVLAASLADSTLPPANIDAIWAIGARVPQEGGASTPEYLWQGQIDDVRIYGRALSADEVLALYQR